MGPREEYEEPIASLAGKDLPKTVQKSWKKFEKTRKFDKTVHTGEMENPVSEKSTEKIESTETRGLYKSNVPFVWTNSEHPRVCRAYTRLLDMTCSGISRSSFREVRVCPGVAFLARLVASPQHRQLPLWMSQCGPTSSPPITSSWVSWTWPILKKRRKFVNPVKGNTSAVQELRCVVSFVKYVHVCAWTACRSTTPCFLIIILYRYQRLRRSLPCLLGDTDCCVPATRKISNCFATTIKFLLVLRAIADDHRRCLRVITAEEYAYELKSSKETDIVVQACTA